MAGVHEVARFLVSLKGGLPRWHPCPRATRHLVWRPVPSMSARDRAPSQTGKVSYQSRKLGVKRNAFRQRGVTDLGRLALTCGIADSSEWVPQVPRGELEVIMTLAAGRSIRYPSDSRASGTETPHPIEIIEVLGRTTRREPGGGGP